MNDPESTIHVDERIVAAVQNCVCYVHSNDAVPFLGADAVLRLADTLREVDAQFQGDRLSQFLQARDFYWNPTPKLIATVRNGAQNMTRTLGAERLIIPSKFILWFRETGKHPAATKETNVKSY